jgi:hypothetical protein
MTWSIIQKVCGFQLLHLKGRVSARQRTTALLDCAGARTTL